MVVRSNKSSLATKTNTIVPCHHPPPAQTHKFSRTHTQLLTGSLVQTYIHEEPTYSHGLVYGGPNTLYAEANPIGQKPWRCSGNWLKLASYFWDYVSIAHSKIHSVSWHIFCAPEVSVLHSYRMRSFSWKEESGRESSTFECPLTSNIPVVLGALVEDPLYTVPGWEEGDSSENVYQPVWLAGHLPVGLSRCLYETQVPYLKLVYKFKEQWSAQFTTMEALQPLLQNPINLEYTVCL